nr:SpoIIE family protein phosphatase [Lachnospiraceae bacterium]
MQKISNKGILFKVGALVLATLLIALVLIAQDIYHSAYDSEKSETLMIAENVEKKIRIGAPDESVGWFIDYCRQNFENMNIEIEEGSYFGDVVKYEDPEKEKIKDQFLENSVEFSIERINEMSEDEQKYLAEIWYDYIYRTTYLTSPLKENVFVSIFEYIGNDKAFSYFNNSLTVGSDKVRWLGKIIPFTIDKHPAAKEILNSDIAEVKEGKIEKVIFSNDNTEYIGVMRPLIIGGKVKSLIVVNQKWSDTKKKLMEKMFNSGGSIVLYLIIADAILLLLFNLEILKPVKRMKKVIREYIEEKESDKVKEKLKSSSRRNDEIGSLSRDFENLTVEIDNYCEEIYKLAEDKSKAAAELSLAAKIQADALPDEFPIRKEFDLYAFMKPTFAVGGDFYDFFFVDDDHLALIIADVSDKGVPSALFMMLAQTMLEASSRKKHPKEIFKEVNNRLCKKS